jgi:hypothetical protein
MLGPASLYIEPFFSGEFAHLKVAELQLVQSVTQHRGKLATRTEMGLSKKF